MHLYSVVDSHPDTAPSLRIDKPFPALLDHAKKLDFDKMDVTDHGHIPYVIILVRVMEDWKASVRHSSQLTIHVSYNPNTA